MKKYLLAYNAPPEALAMMAKATPEEQMEGMKPWMEWKERLGAKLINMGAPLMPGQKFTSEGHAGMSGTSITGFSIIEAADMEEAKSMIKDHPHLSWSPGCEVNIFEFMPMG